MIAPGRLARRVPGSHRPPRGTLAALLLVAGILRSFAGGDLASSLRAHISRPEFAHATWGVVVADAATGQTHFATNAHKLLKPASNAKLFTAALALDALGPDFRIVTDVVPCGHVSSRGTLRGPLVVHGRGDFSMAARFFDGDHERSLSPITDALQKAGIRRIRGDIVADDSFFRGPPHGTGWTWDDLRYYYGAPVGALCTDENVLDLVFHPGTEPGAPVRIEVHPDTSFLEFDLSDTRTVPAGGPRTIVLHREPGSRVVHVSGSLPVDGQSWTDAVPVPDPAPFFAHRLREHLVRNGIRVTGNARHARDTAGLRKRHLDRVIRVESPPLAELVREMMKRSQNLHAQMLLLQAGALCPAPPETTSEAAGILALREFLDQAGIPAREVRMDEGSGLSRSCLITPAAIVRLLTFMDRHPARDAFLDALPVAGVDGTLSRRFRDTPGLLRAKTGTLRHVTALSGFAEHSSGRRLVFAILLNAYEPEPGAPSGREAVDTAATLLATRPLPGASSP